MCCIFIFAFCLKGSGGDDEYAKNWTRGDGVTKYGVGVCVDLCVGKSQNFLGRIGRVPGAAGVTPRQPFHYYY